MKTFKRILLNKNTVTLAALVGLAARMKCVTPVTATVKHVAQIHKKEEVKEVKEVEEIVIDLNFPDNPESYYDFADMTRGLTPEQIRRKFKILDALTGTKTTFINW